MKKTEKSKSDLRHLRAGSMGWINGGTPGAPTYDADCTSSCGGHGEPPCNGECDSGLQLCADNKCWHRCSDGETNGECGTDAHGNPCVGNPGAPTYDADCAPCGGHGEPPCNGECDSAFQLCADDKCWYCCGDGATNGECGTDWHNRDCVGNPAFATYDADCPPCGGHGQVPCNGECDSAFQLCADNKCWYCCGDGATNGECGTDWHGRDCVGNSSFATYDADCPPCGAHSQPSCNGECVTGFQECGDGNCWYCCGDGTTNGICGVDWHGNPCSSDPGSNVYDADCLPSQ